MNVGLYIAKITAEILTARTVLARVYEESPSVQLYWMVVDLAKSSNFRLSRGDRSAYLRGEEFFALVAAALRPTPGLRIVKEMGDAVLISSQDINSLLDTALLIILAARQIALDSTEQKYPFELRIGIDFGIVKQMRQAPHRQSEDFLGECLNRLARIMTVRPINCNLLISQQAYRHSAPLLLEENGVVRVSGPLELDLEISKAFNEPIVYREVKFDPESVLEFAGGFDSWRSVMINAATISR